MNVPRRFLSEPPTRVAQNRIARRLSLVCEQAKCTFTIEAYEELMTFAVSVAEKNERGFLTYPGMAQVADMLEASVEAEKEKGR